MRAAITKLQATKIVDSIIVAMIIVAFAIGGYNYVQSLPPPPKKAEFQVANLTVEPVEAGAGQPITISVNVTNVGEETGNYSVNLTINDAVKETKTIQLSGGESKIVEFVVTESNEGSYSVKIEGLTGTFTIAAAPPPLVKVSDLIISPNETWVGYPINISVKVSNIGDKAGSYSLAFRVNDVVRVTKKIQLSAGETKTVEANVTESSEGTYSVNVGGLTGKFNIVPTGKHTLSIYTNPASVNFTLNGVSHLTPYSELVDVGTYTIAMPDRLQIEQPGIYPEIYQLINWSDGFKYPVRTIDLQSPMLLVANYIKVASCPSLYIWNGTNYVYAGDVSSRGYLGYLNYINEYGWPVFWRGYPWDYMKLDRSQLRPRNGYYDLIITERYDEIFYLDAAYMLVVDHPSDVNVYTTMGEQYIDPNFMGKIYTVSKNPLTPISAVNEKGEDVLPQISKLDGIFTTAHNGIYSASIYNISWNRLTLNLGNLSNAKEIKLIVNGILYWGPDEDQAKWYERFFTQTVPNGTQPIPPPYMEVKDASGNWVRVPESRQFPMLPDSKPRTIVVDLTGLFPTNDYSLRINNFWDVTFDYIGVDTTQQKDVIIQKIDPAYAYLYQAFHTNSISTGTFTRYGDVLPLLLEADDKFVIGRQGDEVSLKFPANIAPPPENMERDFFLYASLWFKEEGNPTVEFTVDPLPFYDMSGFPYPPTESYPYDENHLKYLTEYNTRKISAVP